MKTFEEVLQAHNFVRVHSRYLINSLHIKEYIHEEGGYLVMSNGHQVSVARNRKDQLEKLF